MKFFSRKNIKFILVIFVLIGIIFLSAYGTESSVKGFFLWAVNPFLKTGRIFSGGIRGFFQFLGSIGELKKENEQLIRKNQELEAQIARLKDVEKENEVLRKEIGLVPKKEYNLEASYVIAQEAIGSGSSIIIDKGQNGGIKTGFPVIVSNGIFIGKVGEVYPDTAKVVLLTDKSSAVNAEIVESGAKGIVKGTYGLGTMMEMISQTEIVQEGDTIITSGLGKELPRGLFIGKTGKVGQSGDKLFQQASVILPINLSSLRIVFVVKE